MGRAAAVGAGERREPAHVPGAQPRQLANGLDQRVHDHRAAGRLPAHQMGRAAPAQQPHRARDRRRLPAHPEQHPGQILAPGGLLHRPGRRPRLSLRQEPPRGQSVSQSVNQSVCQSVSQYFSVQSLSCSLARSLSLCLTERCNPRKLLALYHNHRRACSAAYTEGTCWTTSTSTR